jgi:REP element-mobilizing transposase RayT
MPSAAWPVPFDPEHLYFITTAAIHHAHLFQRDLIKRILVDSLNTGRILGQYELYAFVIMPNHIHIIIKCLNNHQPKDVVREYKKATAKLILRQLAAEGADELLEQLAQVVSRTQKQRFAVWEPEYQAKNIYSSEFVNQQLNYIHNNPLQPHWRLAGRPEAYIWSSARFYAGLGDALIPLTDARPLIW